MGREYFIGAWYPFIGFLKERGSLPLEELKSRYMNGASRDTKERRETKFNIWIDDLQSDRIITIEYGIVTFNESQWNRLMNIDGTKN